MVDALILSPDEAIALVRPRKSLPSFVTDLRCDGGVVSLTADLRRLVHAPLPVRLAAKAVPTMHGSARIADVTDGIVTLVVEADAAGLPATKLLPLAAGTVEKMARKKGLPAGSVQLTRDATIVVDLAAVLGGRVTSVTGLRFEAGKVVVEGVPA